MGFSSADSERSASFFQALQTILPAPELCRFG
jgi:hypothetical protein